MNRRYSREHAMKLLFGLNFNMDEIDKAIDNYIENNEVELDKLDKEYFTKIINGVIDNKEDIDGKIEVNLSEWKIDRLSKVDLSILRLCIYELLYEEEIPDKVSVNEAINLSKKYSDVKSPSFINGVLGKFFK